MKPMQEIDPADEIPHRVVLGTVEKWILGAISTLIVAGLIAVMGMFFTMRDALIELRVQTASMNETMKAVQVQLGAIPQINAKLAEHEVRLQNSEQNINELRSMRALK
ncbi:MAG: hypothetical protein JSR63_07860 [Proteobacteria bacterium]|nr:hypothetical protein [Pseudomonadota bacterium]